MTTLTIGRLAVDVPVADPTDPAPVRVDRLARVLADRALAVQLAPLPERSGHWCVRRLELDLPLAPDEPDAAAVDRWARLIAAAVAGLVADGVDVLHYRNQGRLLVDLVCRLAAGDPTRGWAWRQAGVLLPGDPDPAFDPAGALVTGLRRNPDLVAQVLAATVPEVGVSALDRLLGVPGWVALAAAAVDASGSAATPPFAPFLPTPSGGEPTDGPEPTVSVADATKAAAVLAQSRLATAFLAAGEPASPLVLVSWATLCAAEAEPGSTSLVAPVAAALRRSWADRALARRAPVPEAEPYRLDASRNAPEHDAGVADRSRAAGSVAPASAGAGSGTAGDDRGAGSAADPMDLERADVGSAASPPAGTAPTARLDDSAGEPGADGAPTVWAGLPFLLNTATAAGLPGRLDDDPRLVDRTRRWILHQVGLRLVPVAGTDPAALALAGLTPESEPPAGPAPTETEESALTEHATRWLTVTEQRLAAAQPRGDDSPLPSIWALARRTGQVVADPGWLEVRLDLAGVELAVRRAGLDLDPGWVPWLGTVVVFRYV